MADTAEATESFVEHSAEGTHVELRLRRADGTEISELSFDEDVGWDCQKLIEGLVTHLRHHQEQDGACLNRNRAIKHLEAAWTCLEDHKHPLNEQRGHLYSLKD